MEKEFEGSEEDKLFTRERTLRLIELYKQYRKKLGTYEIKTMKKLWEVISTILSNEYKITIIPNKCENRFKVLERNDKKVVDNNNKTGRARKVFEFEKEMEDLFEKKINIKPILLISNSAVESSPIEICIPEIGTDDCPPSTSHEIVESITVRESDSVDEIKKSDKHATKLNRLKRKRIQSPSYTKRNEILQDIANNLKTYYEKRDKRQQEKLEIEKRKLENREKKTEIAREYLDFLKKSVNSQNGGQ